MRINFFIFAILFLVVSCQHKGSCVVKRAAFDIGSGTTKMLVAKVDTCKKIIIENLLYTSTPIGYRDDLEKGDGLRFSSVIMQDGMKATKELQAKALALGASEFYGVATSAFRTAINAQDLTSQFDRELGIDVKILSHEQEAALGFKAAILKRPDLKGDVLVWDIGGGSLQMVVPLANEHFDVYAGKIGSVSFKNHVIVNVQNKNSLNVISPNPMTKNQVQMALRDIRTIAKFSVPDEIKSYLKLKKPIVIGVGGVHASSVLGQIGKKEDYYTQAEVDQSLWRRYHLKDNEIKSKYKETEITNLIMVLGYMQELKIDRVELAEVNLTLPVMLQ